MPLASSLGHAGLAAALLPAISGGIAVQPIAAARATIRNWTEPASPIFSSGMTDHRVAGRLGVSQREKTSVKDQVHIRNVEAAQLARALARQTDKTIGEVVLDALRQYRPHHPGKRSAKEMETWRRLLRKDREGLTEIETPIVSLYDEHTGLPA